MDPPLKNIVRKTPVPGAGCASKNWSFSSARKNLGTQHPLGAKIWSPEKVDLGGYNYTSRSPKFLDQCSPDFFSLNTGQIAVDQVLVRFWISSSVPEIFAVKHWSRPKSGQIWMFLAPKIFWGRAPEILNWHYKIRPRSDHRAEFQAHQPTHLRDLTIEIKK